MSRKPEQQLWDRLRPAFQAAGVRALRVENMLDDGFPDIITQHSVGGFVFIETKSRVEPPVRVTSLALGKSFGLRLSQRNWWLEFLQAGGRAGLIVTRMGDLVYAHESRLADELNHMSMERFCDSAIGFSVKDVVALCNGSWDWT